LGAWFRRKEVDSTAAVGRCCTQNAFSGFPILQGNAESLDRWGGKTKRRMIPYFLCNISAKNYRNRIVYMSRLYQMESGTFLRHGVVQYSPAASSHLMTAFEKNMLQ